MNIYLIGMAVTMVLYLVIGALISKSVKNANDFYVAGRNAPTFLITGSLVASFIGVGLFMGDVGEAYSGFFAPIMVAVGVLSVGYVLGSVFFGRYLRRSNVLTIPEFFGKRFNSPALKMLATITGTFIDFVRLSPNATSPYTFMMIAQDGLVNNQNAIWVVYGYLSDDDKQNLHEGTDVVAYGICAGVNQLQTLFTEEDHPCLFFQNLKYGVLIRP